MKVYNLSIELTIYERDGKHTKILLNDKREVKNTGERNRIIRKMLSDADDKFSDPERRPFKSMWKVKD